MSVSGVEPPIPPPGETRWPPWLAAILLLAAVVVLLGGGLLLTRRPVATPVAATDVPTSVAQATAPVVAAPVPATIAPTPVPTGAPAPVTTPAPAALSTQGPVAATPLVSATLESFSSQTMELVHGTPAVVPTFGPTATPGGTEWWNDERPADPALAAQVEQAYNRYWDVRSSALYTLDTSELDQVLGGVALTRQVDAINELKGKNNAQMVVLEHNARVLHASDNEAAVEDEYLDHTVLIDFATKQPLEPPPSEAYVYDYELRKIGDTWKVMDTVRVNYD